MACKHCPFAFTNASEEVQNYGCLPSPYEIIQMKRNTGHNWACHSNENSICMGFADHVKWEKENVGRWKEIDTSKGNLISYETWFHEGEEAAIKKANGEELRI